LSPSPARVTLATVLLAAGTSWNAGNIGPVTSALSADFAVSLTAVGLLSGTVFFAGILVATVLAPALIAGVAGVVALPFLPQRMESGAPERHAGGVLAAVLRSPPLWRVALVYVGSFGVQLIVGAWLIHYLTEDGGMAVALAGGLAFLMFAVSATARDLGGTLSARGVSPVLLVGVAPLLATAGLAMLSADRSAAVALGAVVLMGIGFSLPYAVMMDEAQSLFPQHPLAPITVLQLAANAIPMIAIPIVGAALAAGSGEAALLALAAFCAVGGVANFRPAVPPDATR